MKTYGVDLSKWNGDVDFQALKKDGNTFVILRAGCGTTIDPKFNEYYKQAKAVGLNVGVYWYSYALNTTQASVECNTLLKTITEKQVEYPIYVDMEDADNFKQKNGMPSNSTLVNICKKFCTMLESNKYYSGVYASESWFKNQLSSINNDRFDRFVANWGTNNGKLQSDKSKIYRLHQFTSKYKLNGKTFDRSVCYYNYPTTIKKKGLNGFTHKTNSQIVEEVIAGKWGNGLTRKKQLINAGYDYNLMQSLVKKKLKK